MATPQGTGRNCEHGSKFMYTLLGCWAVSPLVDRKGKVALPANTSCVKDSTAGSPENKTNLKKHRVRFTLTLNALHFCIKKHTAIKGTTRGRTKPQAKPSAHSLYSKNTARPRKSERRSAGRSPAAETRSAITATVKMAHSGGCSRAVLPATAVLLFFILEAMCAVRVQPARGSRQMRSNPTICREASSEIWGLRG